MLRWLGVLATASAGFSATQAAPPQAMSFNCDAAAGEVSLMDQSHLGAAKAISGNLRAVEAREDNNLQPVATVRLASRKDFVALQMAPSGLKSGEFVVVVRHGDAKEEERLILGEVTLNQSMPFRIAQNGKDVTVTGAGATISVRQSFRGAPGLGVSCSTGRFLFDNVQVQ